MLDKHVSFGWGEPVDHDDDGHREEHLVATARSQRKLDRARVDSIADEMVAELVPTMTPDEFRAHVAQKITEQALRQEAPDA